MHKVDVSKKKYQGAAKRRTKKGVCTNWEPVDPVVADPVRQDNDKRNNIQIWQRPRQPVPFLGKNRKKKQGKNR